MRDLSLPIEAKEITKGAVWIANPPRTGLEESLITLLDDSKATCLFYLSCHPATLARDTKKMGSIGWQIKAIQAFDCFAQTTHFETALYLERT